MDREKGDSSDKTVCPLCARVVSLPDFPAHIRECDAPDHHLPAMPKPPGHPYLVELSFSLLERDARDVRAAMHYTVDVQSEDERPSWFKRRLPKRYVDGTFSFSLSGHVRRPHEWEQFFCSVDINDLGAVHRHSLAKGGFIGDRFCRAGEISARVYVPPRVASDLLLYLRLSRGDSALNEDLRLRLDLDKLAIGYLPGKIGAILFHVSALRLFAAHRTSAGWAPANIRIQAPAGWDLHVALQDSMGWLDYHLHLFRVTKPFTGEVLQIGVPDDDALENDEPVLPGWEIPIAHYFSRPGVIAQYDYDFGDGWEHELTLEAILPQEPGKTYPRCVAGARACPPEDCGGIGGYENLVTVIQTPTHEEYESTLQWLGGRFDPERLNQNT